MEITAALPVAKDTTAATNTSTSNTQQHDKDGDGTTQTTTAPTTTTTHSESLTTPVLSLATPNLLSSLPPPLFSGLTGDFSFNSLMGSGGLSSLSGLSGGGGGGGGELSSALVAFPVSIQPSSSSGGNSGAGNIVLQAQNMGQPFLLTPNMDPRQNPMLSQQSFTPPPSSLSPNVRDLEQLKQQYERVQQQLLQQQLFISQQLQHQQQQTPAREGGAPALTRKSPAAAHRDSHGQRREPGGDGGGGGGGVSSLATREARSDASIAASSPLESSQEDMDTVENCDTPPKRPRLETSPEQPTSV